jgi:hypothetical protein
MFNKLARNPNSKAFRFLEPEHSFERVLCREVNGLGGKVAYDIGAVSTPDFRPSSKICEDPQSKRGAEPNKTTQDDVLFQNEISEIL